MSRYFFSCDESALDEFLISAVSQYIPVPAYPPIYRRRARGAPEVTTTTPAMRVDFGRQIYQVAGTIAGLFTTVLVEMQAPAEVGGPLYVGSQGFLMGPSSPELYNVKFVPRLQSLVLSKSALDSVTVGGMVALSGSYMVLDNFDNSLSWLVERQPYLYRKIRVWGITANPRMPWLARTDTAQLIFTGTVIGITSAGTSVQLSIGDALVALDQELMLTKYDGATNNGGTSLKDQPLPVALGRVSNISPVYLGQQQLDGINTLPTYQVNWSSVYDIPAVRVRGVPMAKISSGVPAVGQYRPWLASGKFQVGSTPSGAVTCDVYGHDGGTYGFQTSMAGILRKLIVDVAGVSTASCPDTAWDDVLQIGGDAGIYIGPSTTRLLDALNLFCTGAQVTVHGRRDGTIAGSLLDTDNTSSFSLIASDAAVIQEEPLPSSLLPRPDTFELIYQPNYTIQTDKADTVTDDMRTYMGLNGRKLTLTATYATNVAKKRKLSFNSPLWDATAATNRVSQIKAWMESEPRIYRVVTDVYLGQVEIGMTCTLTYGLLGAVGRDMQVVEFSEDLIKRQLTLLLVG